MTSSWQFSEAEFYVLWMDQLGEDPPDPFMFTSATRTAEEFDAELRAARESLSRQFDRDFRSAFDTISDPDLYLTVYGWDERARWSVGPMIRIRALRKGRKGYVIRQLPGPTHWRRGGYTVDECDPYELASVVVASLPPVDRGNRGDIELVTDDQELDHDFRHSPIAAGVETEESRTKEFLTAPAATAGEIHIVQGKSAYGPRGITHHRVRYRDLEDDGRYAITDNPARALAVDSSRLTSILDDRVAKVLQAMAEEGMDPW
ncbi:ESX secretion-associated protein EspG [Nocardia sp. NPDC088792]|uniref:ESX secretion-associated protein EspG n=1 Tax=Nocardia sp. NPDC088792 TaxID=3364332 RepID=UPI00381BE611